jgi:Xaa-Pro aminopeptidase
VLVVPRFELQIMAHSRVATSPHRAGHGVRTSLGEDPQLIPSEHRALEARTVLVLGPGVYDPGRIGVPFEDLNLVTPSGGEPIRAEGTA